MLFMTDKLMSYLENTVYYHKNYHTVARYSRLTHDVNKLDAASNNATIINKTSTN